VRAWEGISNRCEGQQYFFKGAVQRDLKILRSSDQEINGRETIRDTRAQRTIHATAQRSSKQHLALEPGSKDAVLVEGARGPRTIERAEQPGAVLGDHQANAHNVPRACAYARVRGWQGTCTSALFAQGRKKERAASLYRQGGV